MRSGGSWRRLRLDQIDLPVDEAADDLFALVRANIDNEADEVMWGVPGTMLAARAMLDQTGDERWAKAWRRAAQTL